MHRTKRPANAFARKSCVIATEFALAMMAAPLAFAQTAERGERIEVTGTRIPSPNIESTSPVAVVTAQDIKLEGVTRIEDMLNSLPQVFADFGATISNGAIGTATVNLRNLGAVRTLVLMNGKRLPIGTPGTPGTSASYAPDLNQIPAPLINRIEVLTGGASAVYGSDAIAGVVNFIMRDNFEGVQGDINYSWYQHQQHNALADVIAGRVASNPAQFHVPDDVSSAGESTEASLLMGGNFANGKGNATVFFDYKKDKPILQSSYDYSACATGVNGAGTAFTCSGSSTNATGRFVNNDTGASFTVTNAAGTVRPFNATLDQFNFAPYNYFQRPDTRYGFSAFAHYDINEHVRAYTEFNYHDSHTVAQIAPSGVFAFLQVPLFADNPFLSQSFRDALGITSATTPTTIGVARRNVEGGGRQDDIRHTSGRAVFGVKGDIFKNWDYDIYAQSARVAYQESYLNDMSNTRILNALDVVSVNGVPTCRSVVTGTDPNCVPFNIFQAGGVTQGALNYVQVPGLKRGSTEQSIQGATLSTDLANYGLMVPGSKSGIGLAAGFERRVDKLELQTDVAFTNGDLAGQGGPTIGLQGQTEVKDYFVEVRVPVRDFFSVNASYRYSDYSSGKTSDSYGIGMELAPHRMFKARASYQQAVRAANVIEMFQAQGLQLFGMSNDPCSGPTPSATLAQCQRSGITAAQYGSVLLTSPAAQYNSLAGGNPNLNPETAKTYTAGIVFTPLRNLSATIDYFNIEVEDVIGTLPPNLVVTQCVFSDQFCNLVHRGLGGTLWSDPSGFVTATNINIAKLTTAGVDVSVNYNYNLASYGGLGFSFLGTWLDKLTTEPIPGLGEYNCVGYHGPTCGVPTPEWRHKFRVVWSAPWKFDLAATWRHIGKVQIETLNSSPLLNDTANTAPVTADVGARDYFDLALTFNIWKQLSIRAGVNNIFDRDPPVFNSSGGQATVFGNGNTYPQVYDCCGRKFFVGATVNF